MKGTQLAAITLIVGIVVGFGIGFVTPGLLPPVPQLTLVQQIQQRGFIIVGTSADFPPFEFVNTTTSEIEGLDPDIVQLIADHLGVTIQWSDMSFETLVGACLAGTIDMIAAAMFVTPSRAEQLAHSLPYLETKEVVVVKNDSTLTITSLSDLQGHQVGVQSGTLEEEELADAGVTTVTSYPDNLLMMNDLDADVLDAVFIDKPVFDVFSATINITTIFTKSAPPTAFFAHHENPDLMLEINEALLNAFEDGTLDAILEKWLG